MFKEMLCKPLCYIFVFIMVVLGIITVIASGGGGGDNNTGDNGDGITTDEFIVLAWNDLGMHCLNPTYDKLVILPPYNTQWVQIIKRGNPPEVVTLNIQVSYSILNNTSSHDKLSYGQFWTYALDLFGVDLQTDYGLNLRDPDISHTLSGDYELVDDHFQADGIPVVPLEDGASTRNPYQIAVVTVKDLSDNTLATTRATIPTSDEINCAKCHGNGTVDSAFDDIADKHDEENSTNLSSEQPRLCAECHGTPVLGQASGYKGSSGIYLSEAIHGFHGEELGDDGIGCYDCHPGETAQCSRSEKHMGTANDGNCITCHGTMSELASEITSGTKVPWIDEPKCATCHNQTTTVAQVDTGSTLYRNAVGHGGLYCAACHQSPHAMVPSVQSSDNYQALQYQDEAIAMGSCRNCHGTSAGGGSVSEFGETHAGSNPEATSACNVCHTALPSDISSTEFPHQFTWKKTRTAP